jgi:ABC-type multidrug transport system, ATPase and permease components
MKKKKKRSSFVRLMRYLGRDMRMVTVILVMLTLSTAFDIFAPKVVQGITDSIKLFDGIEFDWDYLTRQLIILALLYILVGVCLAISKKALVKIAENTVFSLRQRMQKKLEVMSLNYLDTHKRGDILARATSDMVMVTNMLETNLSSMFVKLLTIAGILIMMFVTSVKLALIFVIMLPLSIFIMKFITRVTRKLFKSQQQALGELNSHIEEIVSGNDVMRAFNYEEESGKQLDEINKRFFKTYLSSRTISGVIHPVMSLLNNSVYIAVCVFGGISIIKGNLTLGGLQAFLLYANNISGPVNQFSMMINQVQAGLAAADRVFDLLDEDPEIPDSKNAVEIDDVNGIVEFSHVKFGYSPEQMLMKDVNFTADAGQVFAIVGPSGAGKTTLVNLLMRFYEINGGSINLDGTATSEMTRQSLRKNMGMVLQDTWIFSGTVFDNIAYGKPGATMEEVVEAAKKAQCDSFIRKLPDGYNTMIDAESSALSTGEKQLLAIARVVIADPKILILDEATSNIDTRTEVLITNAMNEMMKGRTSFIIAHRLFTIRNADSIIFMKDGDILEVGKHNELMERGGYYAEMYRSSYQ